MACREIIPKVVRQFNLAFKPQLRLELLLRTFGWVFVARSRKPGGEVALSICIARKAAVLTCTPQIPTRAVHAATCVSFANVILMLMHGFVYAFLRFEIYQGNA